MAERTLTSSPALSSHTRNVMAVEKGTNSVPFYWTAAGQTISASDLVYLAKIPHGAHVTNIPVLWGWWGGSANATLDIGFSGETSVDYLVVAGAISATATSNLTIRTGALPHFISLSDDTQPRFRYLQAKFASVATQTTTAIIAGVITYVMGLPTIGR